MNFTQSHKASAAKEIAEIEEILNDDIVMMNDWEGRVERYLRKRLAEFKEMVSDAEDGDVIETQKQGGSK